MKKTTKQVKTDDKELERDIFRRVKLLTAAVRKNDLAKYKEAVTGCREPNVVETVVFLAANHHQWTKADHEKLWVLAMTALQESEKEKLSHLGQSLPLVPEDSTSANEGAP